MSYYIRRHKTPHVPVEHLHIRSAWCGHASFGMFVVEVLRPKVIVDLGVHFGTSTFAFCQAVDILGLDATVYAIDLWPEHDRAARMQEAFNHVNEWAEKKGYTRFLRIIRDDFHNAVHRFSVGEIELLHIDGAHDYDSVRRDFEAYYPKLSPTKSIVLFHDTRFEENPGAKRFFNEIRDMFPSLEFPHCYGLGVIAVGWLGLPEDAKAMFLHRKQDVLFHFESVGRQITHTVR